jgi:8-oxo-dGTP pyrophosphatase MutT (NUDIX family)
MRIETLCLLVSEDNQVYLSKKKKGNYSDSGRLNGYGGKVKRNETPKRAAVRETREEAGVVVLQKNLELVGILNFYFPYAPKGKNWDQIVNVYKVRTWKGKPGETKEMYEPQKFYQNKLPFKQMWPADKYWMRKVLEGKKLKGIFVYGKKDKVLLGKIDYVNDF